MVSIPQSGFGAFELPQLNPEYFNPFPVSIPQSGFGAFELVIGLAAWAISRLFQSLSRDSGRLNYFSN